MDWRDIQGINNSLAETRRIEAETARVKAEQERQAQLAQQAQQVQQQSDNGLNAYEQQAYTDLVNQGANEEDAYNVVKNGGSVTHDANIIDNAWGLAKQAGASFLKDANAIGATIGRTADAIFGENTFKPFDGKLNKWFDDNTEKLSQYLERNRINSMDNIVSYNKKTGEYKVESAGGLAGDLAFDMAGAVPLMVECKAGPYGVGLAATAKYSDALHEYKLTEKEENDLWDVACAVGKGASLVATMQLGGKVGGKVGNYVSEKAGATFQKIANKYGDTAAKKFLSTRIAAFLGSQAGAQTGGLVSGETMMVGDVAIGDAIDSFFKGHDKDIWGDIKEAAKDGAIFHFGMQGIHGATRLNKPFKFMGEYKSWQEASNLYADNLKKNGFTYKGQDVKVNGDDAIWTGEYKGRKCFITDLEGGNYHIKFKDRNNNDRYTDAVVDRNEVKTNGNIKNVHTFAGSELVRFVKPVIPNAQKDKSGNYQYNVEGEGKGVIGNVDAKSDGEMFYVNENGKRELKVYNAAENKMQSVEDYDYFKKLNEPYEPEAEVAETAVETPNATEQVEQPTAEVNAPVEPVNDVVKVDELDRGTYVSFNEEGEGVFSTIEFGGEDYIVPNGSIERLNESGDFTTEAYKINTNGGLEKTTLTIEEPNKQKIIADGKVGEIDRDSLKGMVGEEVETPADKLENENEVEEQEKVEDNNGDGTDTDNSGDSGNIVGGGAPAELKEVNEEGQPNQGAQAPQPVETPLVDRNFGIDLTKNVSDNDIYVELVKVGNAQSAEDFDILVSAVESQMADCKKAKQFGDAMVLSKVLERLKTQKETAKNLAKDRAKAEADAKSAQEKALKRQQNEAEKIADIESNGRIENARLDQEEKKEVKKARIRSVKNSVDKGKNVTNKVKEQRAKKASQKKSEPIVQNSEVVNTAPTAETQPTPTAQPTQLRSLSTKWFEDQAIEIVNGKGQNKLKRNRLDALKKTPEYAKLSDKARAEVDAIIENAKEPFMPKERKAKTAKAKEDRSAIINDVKSTLANIVQSDTVADPKAALKQFKKDVENDSRLTDEEKKMFIEQADNFLKTLDEPLPPTGTDAPTEAKNEGTVEETTAPTETAPVDEVIPVDKAAEEQAKADIEKSISEELQKDADREEAMRKSVYGDKPAEAQVVGRPKTAKEIDAEFWAKANDVQKRFKANEDKAYDELIADVKSGKVTDANEIYKRRKDLAKDGYAEKNELLDKAISDNKAEAPQAEATKTTKGSRGGKKGNKQDSPEKWINGLKKYRENQTAEELYTNYNKAKEKFDKEGADTTELGKIVEQLKKEAEAAKEGEKRLKSMKEDELKSSPKEASVEKLEGVRPSEDSKRWTKVLSTVFDGAKGWASHKKEFFDRINRYAGTHEKFDVRKAIEYAFDSGNEGMPKWLNESQARALYKMLGYDVEKGKYADILAKMKNLNKADGKDMNFDMRDAFESGAKESFESEAPKHILTADQFNAIKKGFERSGVFKRVKVLEDIVGRYEQICGKEAADALRSSNGELLGFTTKNGEIFLSKKALSADTLVHETAHCLFKAFRENGLMTKQSWNELTMLAERCGVLDELPAVYRGLSKDAQVEEAIVRAIGKKGGIKLQGTLWERFKEAAKRQWTLIKSYLGFDNAKDELSFNDIANMYADKIVNGKYDAEERRVLDEINKGVEETEKGFEADVDEMAKTMHKEDVENVKLAFSNGGGKGIWDSNEKMRRAVSKWLGFKGAHDIIDERNSYKAKLKGDIARMLLDTFDPVYRLSLTLHKKKAYFDGDTDFVERIAQAKSIIMAQQNKLMNGEIKGLDDAYTAIEKLKIKVTDIDGNEKLLDRSMVNRILQCRNAMSGRNERQYEEGLEKERKKIFGPAEKAIRESAKHAMFVAKQAGNAIKTMRTEIEKYENEYINASAEDKPKVEQKLINAYRRILTKHNVVLKKSVDTLNHIKDGIKHAEEAKLKKDDPSAVYTPSADLAHEKSLNLHTAKYSTKGLNELRDLFAETKSRVESIVDEIEKRKIQDRIDKFQQEFEDEVRKDATRMPQTEWLHKVWEKANPNKCPIRENWEADLNQAIADKQVQKYKTDGCGVSNKDAEAFMKEVEGKVPAELLKELYDKVEAINNYTLDKAREGGLITEDEHAKLKSRNANEHYVPLRGFKYDPKKADSDFTNSLMNDSSGADRHVVTAAEGRISEADDAYKSMINLASSSIVSAQNNICTSNFYRMLADCQAKRGKQANFEGDLSGLVTLGKWYKKDANGDWKLTNEAPEDNATFKDGTYTDANGEEFMWKNGDVKEFGMNNNMDLSKARQYAVNLCLDGNKVQMVFKDKSVADAFNQTNKKLADKSLSGTVGSYMKAAFDLRKKINNAQSKWLTSWSVRFAIANHERDLATYFLRLSGSGYKDVTNSFFESYRDIFKAVLKGDANYEIDVNGQKMKVEQLLNDFGLATGYVETGRQESSSSLEKKVEDIRNQRAERFKVDADGKYTNEKVKEYDFDSLFERLMDKRPEKLKDSIEEIGKFLHNAGEFTKLNRIEYLPKFAEFLELVPRLAAFKVAMRNGADFNQAIQFGKNITANFNRNGDLKYHSLGKILYATVPFFNAGMQGLKMAYDMTQQNPTRVGYTMLGMLAVGLIANEFERYWYGDNEYGQAKATTIDDYNRGSSIRIPVGREGYVPLYMPHFFRMPLDFSMNVSDCLHGDRTWGETFWGSVGSLADLTHFDFSKLGDDGGWKKVATQFSPLEVKIGADLMMNENFFGSQIYKEPFDEDKNVSPEWTMTIGNGTYPALIEACKLLNELGGGTDNYAAGSFHVDSDGSIVPNKDSDMGSWLNRNPQALQYIISQYLPITQIADYGYRGYKKADKEESEYIIPKTILATLQLDKVSYRKFTDGTITAGNLAKGARKGMEIMKSLRKNKEVPKTPKMRAMMNAYERISHIQNEANKIRKSAVFAEQNGNKALAKKLSDRHDKLMFQQAAMLYELQSYDQLTESQRSLKDWWETNINK